MGGNSADQVNAVVRDGDGNTYACGVTRTNAGGIRRDEDAFVVRFAANGTPQAVTYLGGNADDACNGLAIDFAGRILLAGGTESLDFPCGVRTATAACAAAKARKTAMPLSRDWHRTAPASTIRGLWGQRR